ncbi:MAG: right-handed parallel beta-helix repeat-containing protein [Candidatus Poribacteria bacterium]|nr:right-handed parallel beta-helix repeat-containing protein [Candidatus Poribacteria bacterium]
MQKYRCYMPATIILILLCVNIQTFAATIHVPADQPTIQSGIDAAKDGDTVLVADGIYKGEGNVNIDFKGKKIVVKSQNGAETTTISCRWTENTRGFIFQNGETHDSVLDGFSIMNGIHDLGGGIYCNNSSPTIKNCVIAWNRAAENDRGTGYGGGIYCFNSDAKIIDSIISNNRAESAYGGGVYFDGNTIIDDVILRETSFKPSLLNCTISDNTGSGVHIQSDASSEIRDSKIIHNSWRGIICTFFFSRRHPHYKL